MTAHGTSTCYRRGCRCDLCKTARNAAQRERNRWYYERNRERLIARSREYHWRNRDVVLARKRESYRTHKPQHKLACAEWYRANKDYVARKGHERRKRLEALDCSRNGQAWTPAEDSFLMNHDDLLVVATTLKRSMDAIRTRRYYLRTRRKILSTTPGKD